MIRMITVLMMLSVTTAQALAPLQIPTPQQLGVSICVGGSPYVAYQITGTSAQGFTTGLAFEQVKCSTTGYHAGCALVYWDPATGIVQSIDLLYTTTGRLPASADSCLNPIG